MRDGILAAIYLAVDDLNAQLPAENRLEKDEATAIVGDRAKLDSLNVVNLIIRVEERVNERVTSPLNLVEKFVESEKDPPETLGALATLILELRPAC
jgi:acyl carrier protein